MRYLIEREDEPYCFRLHKDRVYYVSERVVRQATVVARKQLLSIGTCFGKFTGGGKFFLHITCLDYLAQFAKYKIWLKANAEMSFLYGNHITKAAMARMTQNTPQYQGVVVYSFADVPIGFATTARSTDDCRKLEPTAVAAFHVCDVGEYLRNETPGGAD